MVELNYSFWIHNNLFLRAFEGWCQWRYWFVIERGILGVPSQGLFLNGLWGAPPRVRSLARRRRRRRLIHETVPLCVSFTDKREKKKERKGKFATKLTISYNPLQFKKCLQGFSFVNCCIMMNIICGRQLDSAPLLSHESFCRPWTKSGCFRETEYSHLVESLFGIILCVVVVYKQANERILRWCHLLLLQVVAISHPCCSNSHSFELTPLFWFVRFVSFLFFVSIRLIDFDHYDSLIFGRESKQHRDISLQ